MLENEEQAVAERKFDEGIQLCVALSGENVFVLGETRVGKNIFLQWVSGCEFHYLKSEEFEPEREGLKLTTPEKLHPKFMIGHEISACTIIIAVLPNVNLGTAQWSLL